jgi:hypothetical protein
MTGVGDCQAAGYPAGVPDGYPDARAIDSHGRLLDLQAWGMGRMASTTQLGSGWTGYLLAT